MTGSLNEMSIQLPIVLTDAEAAQIAEKLLYRAWVEREQFEFQLPMKYAELDPGDVVQIDLNGHVHIIRIVSVDMNIPGMIEVKGVADQASVYTSSVTGGAARYPTQTLKIDANTLIEIMDIPALRTEDVLSPGYYVAMYGDNANWVSGVVFKSTDDGASWFAATSNTIEATMGTSTDALGDFKNNYWDELNTVNVAVADTKTLTSITSDAVLAGGNLAVLGDELINFTTAFLEGDGTYTLSGLLRGQFGTEWAIGTHAASDRFVLIQTASFLRIPTNNNVFGDTQTFKGVSNNQFLEDVTTEHEVTFGNLNVKPWSVRSISGSRDGPNNLTIDWIRRDRDIGPMLHNPPMSEESELYHVYIMNGTVVLRILIVTTNQAVYTIEQMDVDGITPGDPVTVQVYQISTVAGKGYVAQETI